MQNDEKREKGTWKEQEFCSTALESTDLEPDALVHRGGQDGFGRPVFPCVQVAIFTCDARS